MGAETVERLEGKGGRFVRGWGHLVGPGRVQVGDLIFEISRAVVIGTGTVPAVPPRDHPGPAGEHENGIGAGRRTVTALTEPAPPHLPGCAAGT